MWVCVPSCSLSLPPTHPLQTRCLAARPPLLRLAAPFEAPTSAGRDCDQAGCTPGLDSSLWGRELPILFHLSDALPTCPPFSWDPPRKGTFGHFKFWGGGAVPRHRPRSRPPPPMRSHKILGTGQWVCYMTPNQPYGTPTPPPQLYYMIYHEWMDGGIYAHMSACMQVVMRESPFTRNMHRKESGAWERGWPCSHSSTAEPVASTFHPKGDAESRPDPVPHPPLQNGCMHQMCKFRCLGMAMRCHCAAWFAPPCQAQVWLWPLEPCCIVVLRIL